MDFCRRHKELPGIILISLLIGCVTGVSSAVIPDLQWDLFGSENGYLISGGISGIKGILGAIYIPFVGSWSDVTSRRRFLLLSLSLSIVPYTVMLASNSFLAYVVLDTLIGVYNVSMALMLMAVCDVLPHAERTEGFSMVLGWFFLGMGACSFIGGYLPEGYGRVVWALSAGLQFLAIEAAYYLVPHTSGGTPQQNNNNNNNITDSSSSAKGDGATSTTGNNNNKASEQQPLINNNDNNTDNNNNNNTDERRCCCCRCSILPPDFTWENVRKHFQRIVEVLRHHRASVLSVVTIVFLNHITQTMMEGMLMMYLAEHLNFTSANLSAFMGIICAAAIACLFIFVEVFGKVLSRGKKKQSEGDNTVGGEHDNDVKGSGDAAAIVTVNNGNSDYSPPNTNNNNMDKNKTNSSVTVPINHSNSNSHIEENKNNNNNNKQQQLPLSTAPSSHAHQHQIFIKNWANVWLLRISLLANALMVGLLAFATEPWHVYALSTLSVVGMSVYPSTCAVATSITEPIYIGVTQGMIASARVIAGIVSPLLFGPLLQYTMDTNFAGWPFLMAASFCVASCLITFTLTILSLK